MKDTFRCTFTESGKVCDASPDDSVHDCARIIDGRRCNPRMGCHEFTNEQPTVATNGAIPISKAEAEFARLAMVAMRYLPPSEVSSNPEQWLVATGYAEQLAREYLSILGIEVKND